MKYKNLIIAAFIGVAVSFATYTAWAYFKEQQAIQQEEDRLAQERRIQKEQEQQARIAAEQAAAQLAARAKMARTRQNIEDIPKEVFAQIRDVARQYILENPGHFLHQRFDNNTFGPPSNFKVLTQTDTDTFMLFTAISRDVDVLQALLDIGMDINRTNKMGYTPLMFATAYNTPEVVAFLAHQGADISAPAYIQNLTSLHMAAMLNPNPDMIDTLLELGANINAETKSGHTPILIACSDNQNLEVAERLAVLGADLDVKAPDGMTPLELCEKRTGGGGVQYVQINEGVDERVLNALR